jgi:glycosyltransferase involved in cell wall biosynthesis
MRILSITWGFTLGGIGKCLLAYDRLNVLSDVEIHTACITLDNNKSDLKPLHKINATIFHIKSRKDFSWMEKAVKLISEFKPDVLFVHGFNGPIIARAIQIKLKRKIPFVCSYHGFYHAPSLSRIPLAPVFNKAAEYVYSHHATAVVAVAQYCKNQLVFRGVPEHKITVIHNGLPARQQAGKLVTRADAGLVDSNFVIGIASRLDPVKGLEYLMDAFAKIVLAYPMARLLLVGDGPCEKNLRKQSAKLDIADKVIFTGYQDNVDNWLDMLDVFALPSLAEYHSIALLEAMRAGKAIVATDVGGNTESVIHERHGLVVPSADAVALKKALIKLIENSELRRRLGCAAQKRYEAEFTEDKMLEKMAIWLKRFA